MNTSENDRIIVGQINGIYGVKGLVKVFSHTDPRENILNYSPWQVRFKGQWRTMPLLEGKVIQGGKGLVALLEGFEDREIARQLMGCEVAIFPEQLPKLGDEDVYWRELMGADVHNEDGHYFGKVTGLVETGAHDVLRVEDKATRSNTLIPFVLDTFIIEVDIADKKILVDWEVEEADLPDTP